MGTYSYGKTCSAIALTVIFTLVLLNFPMVKGQTSTNFTSEDLFSIPSSNGQISFAVNGSYTSASLQDGVWFFSNLDLNGSPNIPIFKISAENSNVTIYYFAVPNASSSVLPYERVRYWVEGEGKVTINFGETDAGKYGGSDWYVSKTGRGQTSFYSLGSDYELKRDGTFSINGIIGNITVTHYFFDRYPGNNPNAPFYIQHSVIIMLAIITAITFSVVLVIWLRSSRIANRLNQNGDGV